MKIFGQGAMFYFLLSMSYFPYFMKLTEGWRRLNISVRKLIVFLFCMLATFARTKKETNMTKKIGKLNVWLMLLVGCTMGITSCKTETKENTQKGYKLVTLTADTDKEIMTSYSASIEGMQDIDIYPQVSGYIEKLNVSEGDVVRKGEVLFVIDQVPYKAALETALANVEVAKASLATAELTYKSTKELYAKKVVSSFNLQTTENEFLTAKAQLAQAKAQEVNARNNLSYTEVKSPSDGVIGMLPYRVGTLVSSNMAQPLTTVSDNTQMYVYFSMTENQFLSLARQYGTTDKAIQEMPEIQLQLNDGSMYEEKGRIESISGVIDKETGTVGVRAVFPNVSRLLHSGASGNVLIPSVYKKCIVIPQGATVQLQDKILAYKVVDGKAVSTLIKVAPVNDGKEYIVLDGLKAGDEIVADGAGMIREGTQVK
jgi:membrane fusion protein (multidrug efflux system)